MVFQNLFLFSGSYGVSCHGYGCLFWRVSPSRNFVSIRFSMRSVCVRNAKLIAFPPPSTSDVRPMLNVLLGIGLSSTYMISRQGGNPYVFETTETLLVSTIGLLMVLMVTLIAVPMNGFMLSRTWGMCLIGAYLIVLVVNVGVEVMGSRSR